MMETKMIELGKSELKEVDGGFPICFMSTIIGATAEFLAGFEAGWSENKS